jgi:hypothetical protein
MEQLSSDEHNNEDDAWQETIIVEDTEAASADQVPGVARPDLEDEDLLREDERGWNAPLVAPFQYSGQIAAADASSSHASAHGSVPPGRRRSTARPFPLLKVLLVCAVIVLAGGFLAFTVFAQPGGRPITTTQHPTQGTPGMQMHPTARPTPVMQKTPALPTPTQATPQSNWVPSTQALGQMGWSAAGLSTGDALEAERTAWTFTDREMGLDYRDAGTQGQHAGTFTAAVFLLTPGARTRFFANDVRVINNALFDRVQQQRLIQEVVNAQPRLALFQVQNQQQFAWVDVAFELWQSQVDQQTGNRVDGFDIDPVTHVPRIHHMIVLLLRVTPGSQGANAPMGGTGWLVSTYALDPAGSNLPAVIQPA